MRLNTATLKTDSAPLVVVLSSSLGLDRLTLDFESAGFEVIAVKGDSLDGLKKWKPPQGRTWYSHPGWTDWGQRPEWAQLVQKMGRIPIGPSAKVINLFSHLINFLSEAEKHQIPNALAHPYPLATIPEAEKVIREYPVVLKNLRSPQFGLGLVDVSSEEELKSKGALWLDHLNDLEGDAFFGIEKFIEGSKLIRMPFSRDDWGKVRFFSAIDHSIQSEYRAYLPVCPAQNVTSSALKEIEEKVASFLDSINYRGVGSMDFLIDANRYYLVGAHCGFKRDSWLWEKMDGVSAVAEQLRALGLKTHNPKKSNSKEKIAAMLFLRAEDPIYQLPASGKIFEKDFGKPEGEWIWANYENNIISHTDSDLIGVWIGEAKNLKELFKSAEAGLQKLWLHGSLLTNQKYLLDILRHPWVKEGAFYLGFLQREFIPDHRPPLEVLQFAANLCASVQKSQSSKHWVILGYKLKTEEHQRMSNPGTKKFKELDETLSYSAYRVTDERWSVRIGYWSFWCVEQKSEAGVLKLNSLVAGTVKRLGIPKGRTTRPGDSLVIIESLKRWVSHRIGISVKVLEWKVKVGSIVEPGQMLAEIEKS